MSIFTHKKVWKFLVRIQLIKSVPKKTGGGKCPASCQLGLNQIHAAIDLFTHFFEIVAFACGSVPTKSFGVKQKAACYKIIRESPERCSTIFKEWPKSFEILCNNRTTLLSIGLQKSAEIYHSLFFVWWYTGSTWRKRNGRTQRGWNIPQVSQKTKSAQGPSREA